VHDLRDAHTHHPSRLFLFSGQEATHHSGSVVLLGACNHCNPTVNKYCKNVGNFYFSVDVCIAGESKDATVVQFGTNAVWYIPWQG